MPQVACSFFFVLIMSVCFWISNYTLSTLLLFFFFSFTCKNILWSPKRSYNNEFWVLPLTYQRILARTRIVLEDYNMSCDDVSIFFFVLKCYTVRLLLSSSWWKRENKNTLPESHQAFEVASGWISGLVNLVLSCETGFSGVCIHFLINRCS